MTLVFSNPLQLYYEDFLIRKYDCEQKRMRSKSFIYYLNLITKHTQTWERSPTFNNYLYTWNTFTALALKRAPIRCLTRKEVKLVLDTIDKCGVAELHSDKAFCGKYKASEPITDGAIKIVQDNSFYDTLFYEYATHKSLRAKVYCKNRQHIKKQGTVTFT